MGERLTRLSPVARLRFCLWCLERFPGQFGDAVWDGLTDVQRERLREILAELAATAASACVVSVERALALQAEVGELGPADEDAAARMEPDAIEFLQAVWQTLEHCRTSDVADARAVSENLLNSWSYHADPGNVYNLANMFACPELRREFEVQEQWVSENGG
jgi:hypothetical protein